MPEARQISDVGVAAHQRYAQDAQLRESELLKGIKTVSDRASIAVVMPFFSDELEELLGYKKKKVPWALIPPPKNYLVISSSLFTSGLARSLGSIEHQSSKREAIMNFQKKKKIPGREKLIALFDGTIPLTEDWELISSEKSRYQKG